MLRRRTEMSMSMVREWDQGWLGERVGGILDELVTIIVVVMMLMKGLGGMEEGEMGALVMVILYSLAHEMFRTRCVSSYIYMVCVLNTGLLRGF